MYTQEYPVCRCVYFRLEENYEFAEGVCTPRSTLYVVMCIFQVGGEL